MCNKVQQRAINKCTRYYAFSRSRHLGCTTSRMGSEMASGSQIGVSADFNLNKHFAIESGLFYTFRGYIINNGGTYSNEYNTWTEHVSQTRHFLQMPVLAKFKWSIDKNRSFSGV